MPLVCYYYYYYYSKSKLILDQDILFLEFEGDVHIIFHVPIP